MHFMYLQFDHERLALFAHLADLCIAVVECSLVATLVILQLVGQRLHLLLEQGVLQKQ